ncbi:TetR/AcrR family transcriptional regulator [Yinghuangia soli]|uniref:TetR/AcrR family transcriptional regulator n=1 Tax=Yinghuangia soli TaxID=2908204 RepID=A0AA41U0V3_9ACTN|nr:TetR/AcrR family transcriptional regulator [Yinghuangia soli]MCF2530173.1 TetR/AcrR family transcriptional regulator [Yinghuangia soli]
MKAKHEVGTRERIVQATSRLMQRHGYEGTGLKEISREAQATLGSVYHFFPGGKLELAVEAIGEGDREFAELLRGVLARVDDPAEAIAACTRELADGMRASDWQDGCPVTTAALASSRRLPEVRDAAERAFANWHGIVRGKLVASGIDEETADELAHTVVSTLEGAEMTAQITRSTAPLDAAGTHLARLIRSYL